MKFEKKTIILIFAILSVMPARLTAGSSKFRNQHPWHAPDINLKQLKSIESDVRQIMSMSEKEILALIPRQTGILFCGCPNCDSGSQESNQLTWTIDKPNQLKCKFCGHKYPSKKYPMNRSQKVTTPLGNKISIPYHLDEKGNDYFFLSKIWYFRKQWLAGQTYKLAKAYYATGKFKYARRSALIIYAFAKAYPDYCVVKQWPYSRREYTSINKPPYPYAGGKWGRWMPGEIPAKMSLAYDLIYNSRALDLLSREYRTNIRKRIENQFFRSAVEYTLTFSDHYSNMSPNYMRRIVRIGRTINEPEYIHFVYKWLIDFIPKGFFFDGMWKESPSYHKQTVSGISLVINEIEGYSDPPGYYGKNDGLHFKKLDPFKDINFPFHPFDPVKRITYPDATAPFHDSWPDYKFGKESSRSSCQLLSGFGHAVLGAGQESRQVQAHLHFSGGYGHHHRDNLNLSLFAFGREMFSDIGYTHTKLRHWTKSTISHNLVAIDQKEQESANSEGDIQLFVSDLQGLSAVEACGRRGYAKLAQMYKRLIILCSFDETNPYVVDVFQVKGGGVHDWLLHGSADQDQSAKCNLELTKFQGSLMSPKNKWVEPVGESSKFDPYGLFKNIKYGVTDENLQVTFRYKGNFQAGTKTHLLAKKNTEVFLAESPSIRRAHESDDVVYQYMMPQLIARRKGEAPNESIFVAIHEPFIGSPKITEVNRITNIRTDGQAIVLEVKTKTRTDLLIICLGNTQSVYIPQKDGDIKLIGKIGVLSSSREKFNYAGLIGGTFLRKGNKGLSSKIPYFDGVIDAAVRKADGYDENALITTEALPVGTELQKRWVIVEHADGHKHAYQIKRVERKNNKTWIYLWQDHGLHIKGGTTKEIFFPKRVFKGKSSFRIYNHAVFSPTNVLE